MQCVAGESKVSSSSATAPIDDRALELVPSGLELPLEVGDKYAQVRIVRTRVHLGDEEDLHRWINRDASGTVSCPSCDCRHPTIDE
jgi:hypothetical protein